MKRWYNLQKLHEDHRVSVFTDPRDKSGQTVEKHAGVLRCRTCRLSWVKWLSKEDMLCLTDLVEGPDPGPLPQLSGLAAILAAPHKGGSRASTSR